MALPAAAAAADPFAPAEDTSSLGELESGREALRPTGRRSVSISLLPEGAPLHFTKLKDHAVLEVDTRPLPAPASTAGRWNLTLGFIVCGLLFWRRWRKSRR